MRTTEQANSAIKVAALVVAGVYLYRRFTEGTAEELKASQKVTPLGRWLVGWGVVFFTLSIAAGPFPGGAGNMAILLALGSLLSNGVEISKDLGKGLETSKQAARTASGKKATTSVPGNPTKQPFETRTA